MGKLKDRMDAAYGSSTRLQRTLLTVGFEELELVPGTYAVKIYSDNKLFFANVFCHFGLPVTGVNIEKWAGDTILDRKMLKVPEQIVREDDDRAFIEWLDKEVEPMLDF